MILGISAWLFWLIIAGILLLIEMVTIILVSIWFVGGALLAALSAALGAPPLVQTIVFILTSALFFFIGWKNRDRILMQRHKTPTNLDRLIGAEGILEESIDHISGAGRVMVNGQSWRAATVDNVDLVKGTLVRVVAIQGTRAIIEPVHSRPNSATEETAK